MFNESLEHIGQAIPPLQDAARGVLEDVARESKRRIELRGPALSGVNSRVQALIDETNHTKVAIDREWAPRARQLRTGLRHGAFADVTGTLRPLLDVLADVDRQARNAGMTMNIDAIIREPLADRREVVFMRARALRGASDGARRAYASIVEREKERERMESSQGQPQDARRRAVILTALPIEHRAVRAHLTGPVEEVHEAGTIYERGRFDGAHSVWEVGLPTPIGKGNAGAAQAVERAIAHFAPAVVLFVGVAGGIKDVALGDVVAGTKVYGYGSGKAKAGEIFETRPDIGESSYPLVERARAESARGDWRARILGAAPDGEPNAIVEPVAAGEAVLASRRSDLFRFIRREYGDAVATEMEGYGFLRGAYANRHVDALVIRGVSDLIVGKGASDKAGWQDRASRHASAFAFQVLDRYIPPTAGTLRAHSAADADAIAHEGRRQNHLAHLKADIVGPIAEHAATFVHGVARHGVSSSAYTGDGGYGGPYRPAIPPAHSLADDWPAHFPAWAARVRAFADAAARYQAETLGLLNDIHARMTLHQGEQYWTPTLDGAILAWLLGLSGARCPVERVDGGPIGRQALYISDLAGGYALLDDDDNWPGVEHDVWLVEQDQDLRARGGRLRADARALGSLAREVIDGAGDILARQDLQGECAFVTPAHTSRTAHRAEAGQRARGDNIAQADRGSTAQVNVSGARG